MISLTGIKYFLVGWQRAEGTGNSYNFM